MSFSFMSFSFMSFSFFVRFLFFYWLPPSLYHGTIFWYHLWGATRMHERWSALKRAHHLRFIYIKFVINFINSLFGFWQRLSRPTKSFTPYFEQLSPNSGGIFRICVYRSLKTAFFILFFILDKFDFRAAKPLMSFPRSVCRRVFLGCPLHLSPPVHGA